MMSKFDWRILLLAVAVSVSLPVAVAAQVPQAAAPAVAHALRISAGDLLELNVFDTPELSGKLRVNEAGEVTVPVAGQVKVAGLTAEEAAAAVEQSLRAKDVLKDPHASIFIVEYATQGVTVGGEVKSPGIYPLLGNHTYMDLISAAGGASPRAGREVTITHKVDPEHPIVVPFDDRPGSVAASVDIQPGDTISVARAGIVYVVGDVNKPGGFLMEGDELTALQALALAQGANKTAAENKSRLIRKTATNREEIPLQLKKILAGKAKDVPVHDGDIVFVPSSGAKNWGERSVEAAIAVTSGLIIYGRL